MSEDLGVRLNDYITIQMPNGSSFSLHVVGIVKTRLETGYSAYIDLAFAQQKPGLHATQYVDYLGTTELCPRLR